MMLELLSSEKQRCGVKAAMIYDIEQFTKNLVDISVSTSFIVPASFYKERYKRVVGMENKIALIRTEILPSIRNFFGETPLVIRSSATCEDSILFSGAGVYDSFLKLKEDDEIINAIVKVYESFETPNASFYAKFNRINYNEESIAILIQELAPVNVSGVLFTRNPVNDNEEIVLEWLSGLGDKVVSGNSKVNHKVIGYNAIRYENNYLLKKLFQFAINFQEYLGYPIDIEWGYNEKYVYVFQVRPICFSKQHREIIDSQKFESVIISKGIGIGRISDIENSQFRNDIILRTKDCTINDILKLIFSRGYIIRDGGMLSHFSNILREFSIPCIYKEKVDINFGDIAVIDAYRNEIHLLSSLSSKEMNSYLLEYIDEIFSMKIVYPFRFEQIIQIDKNEKYEAVIFNLNCHLKSLIEQVDLSERLQKIWTYDFTSNPVFSEGTIIRIREEHCEFEIQIKSIEKFDWYRKETEYIIHIESFEIADNLLRSIGLHRTGYQERKILTKCQDNIKYNYIQWPKGDVYVGVETFSLSLLNKWLKELGYEPQSLQCEDGKSIFDKFGLSIVKCSFGENNETSNNNH